MPDVASTSAAPARVFSPRGTHPGWVEFASPSPTTVYLSGSSNPHTRAAARFTAELGLLATYRSGYAKQIREGRYRIWAADNGVFSKHPWDADRWWRFTTGLPRGTGQCLFVTAPDVLFDAAGTLARSAPWLPRIRALGFPAALVAQDGVEDLLDEEHWTSFDALFIGGSVDWKESRAVVNLMAEARARGKWCHVGRVNTRRRLWPMAAAGADSVDGTKVAAGSDRNLPQLLGWLAELRAEEFGTHQQHRFVRFPAADVASADVAQPGVRGVTEVCVPPRQARTLHRAARHVTAAIDGHLTAGGDPAGDVALLAAFRTLLTAARAVWAQSPAVVTRASRWPQLPAAVIPAQRVAAPAVQLGLFPALEGLPPQPLALPTPRATA